MPEFIPGTRVPASRVVSGPPGTAWVNDTGKVLYQLRVNWVNSCGTCIQRSNLIGPWFPVPFHPNCLCKNIPIFPGDTARPFHDFLDEA